LTLKLDDNLPIVDVISPRESGRFKADIIAMAANKGKKIASQKGGLTYCSGEQDRTADLRVMNPVL